MKGTGGQTIIHLLPGSELQRIEDLLNEEGVELEPCPYAYFRAKAKGCVITFYKSGKLLLQGSQSNHWSLRLNLPEREDTEKSEERASSFPTIGSDESGKGDYFGPLVVAAVFVPPDRVWEVRKAGVQDSKNLKDKRALLLAGWIEKNFPHAIAILPPEKYNSKYDETGRNLNILLAAQHSAVIKQLLPNLKNHAESRVIVDKFGPKERVANALGELPLGVDLIQVPRAEENPAVAAASILARAHFLEGLKACSDEVAETLPKGAGPPVIRAAKWVGELGGVDLLRKVAKLHFKTTQQIGF